LSRKGCGFDSRPRHCAACGFRARCFALAPKQAACLVSASPPVYHLVLASAFPRRHLYPERNRVMFARIRFVGLVMLFCATAASAQAQTTLRYKFKPSDKLAYVVENKMSMKLDVAGKETEMTVSQIMDLAWNIESVASDGK